MVDEIRADLEVNFSGNVNKDLPKVIANLVRLEKIALESASALDKFNNKTKAQGLRDAAAGLASYRKEVEKLATASAKVKSVGVGVGRGDLTGTQGATDLRNKALVKLDGQQEKSDRAEMQRRVSVENSIQAAQRKTAAESARIAAQSEKIVQRDLAGIQRRLDAKRRAAQQEIALAQKVAKAEAESAARTRGTSAAGISQGRADQNVQTGVQANLQYWRDQEAAIKKNSGALRAQFREQEQYINSLSNTRYALYDVSRTATVASVALTAVFAVPITKYAQYEQQFASVARTVKLIGEEVNEVRDDFVDLSTEIPKAFGELAQIGTLAGQLDIPAESIEKFTEVVAKFAATTNVTATTAAEEIGRTAQLTQTAASEYENLASSIYQVGVTSVATEGQILEMMSQISTAGNLAGLANTDIVALAGALASLGIQPEAARGSLQRLFNLIENGATTATKYTGRLSEITRMTTEEMSSLWKDGMGGSQAVFSSFIEGLGRMQDEGQNTTNVLREMGVYQVRDQRLLQVLANNTEIYAKALGESNLAYSEGTALAEGYAQQTNNLADNFTLLLNTLSGIMAEMGEMGGGWLNEAVKGLVGIGKAFLGIVRTDAGKWLGTAALALALIGAGMAGYIALAARLQAAVFGMITAQDGLSKAHVNASFNIHNLSRQLVVAALEFRKGAQGGREFAGAVSQAGTAAATAAVGINGAAAATGRATIASHGVAAGAKIAANGLLALGKAGVVMAALSAVISLADVAMKQFASDADKAERFFGSSDMSGLQEAFAADTKVYEETGKALRLVTTEQKQATASTSEWKKEFQDAAGVQRSGATSIDTVTDALDRQTVAYGENIRAQIAKQFGEGGGENKLAMDWAANSKIIEQAGFQLTKYFDILASEGPVAASKYVEGFKTEIQKLNVKDGFENFTGGVKPITAEAQNALYYLTELTKAGGLWQVQADAAAASSNFAAAALGKTAEAGEDASDSISIAGKEFSDLKSYLDSITGDVKAPYELNEAFRTLGETLAENGNQFNEFSDSGKANLDAVLGVVEQLQSVSGEDQAGFGEGILGLMVALQAEGVNTGEQLSFLGQMLNDTLGGTYNLDFNSGAAQQSIIAVIDKAIAAQRALNQLHATAMQQAGQASNMHGYVTAQQDYNAGVSSLQSLEALRASAVASSGKAHGDLTNKVEKGTKANKDNAASTKKAARSILDWVDDLRTVMKTADELRFGVQDAWADIVEAQKNATKALVETTYDIGAALDKATLAGQHSDNLWSMFYEVEDAAEKAAKEVVDATNSIQEAIAELQNIGSEKSQLEYGLNVAVMYGDLLRAESIRAKLAELDVKQAKTQADLVESQNDLADAIDSQNKSLIGNSKQAIKNRSTVKGLAEEYIDWINQLVEGGASTQELSAAVAQAKADFTDQAVAMGFSSDQLMSYISVFNRGTTSTEDGADAVRDLYEAWQDYILQLVQSGASQDKINAAIKRGKDEVKNLATQMGLAPKQVKDYVDAFNGMDRIIDKIPKNITTKLNADSDPADRAIKDFLARNSNGNGASRGVKVPISAAYDGGKSKQLKEAEAQMAKYAKLIMGTTNMAALTEYSKQWTKWKKISMSSLWTGGYTGRGGKYEPKGIVHGGEYVVAKQDVNQSTKLPYFMERTATVNNNSSVSFPSVIMVELSPTDRALLAENGGSVVMIDGRQIAAAVNNRNQAANMRGNA